MKTRFTIAGKALCVLALMAIQPANAQTLRTEHVYSSEPNAPKPNASIDDIAWLAGHWEGEGLGGQVEETWNAPSGGTMLGAFKLVHGESPSIYEIELMKETENGLEWQVKHFGPDFHAWEEKDEFVSFPLVKMTDDSAYFDGLTISRDGDDKLDIYLVVRRGDEMREEHISLRRVR